MANKKCHTLFWVIITPLLLLTVLCSLMLYRYHMEPRVDTGRIQSRRMEKIIGQIGKYYDDHGSFPSSLELLQKQYNMKGYIFRSPYISEWKEEESAATFISDYYYCVPTEKSKDLDDCPMLFVVFRYNERAEDWGIQVKCQHGLSHWIEKEELIDQIEKAIAGELIQKVKLCGQVIDVREIEMPDVE